MFRGHTDSDKKTSRWTFFFACVVISYFFIINLYFGGGAFLKKIFAAFLLCLCCCFDVRAYDGNYQEANSPVTDKLKNPSYLVWNHNNKTYTAECDTHSDADTFGPGKTLAVKDPLDPLGRYEKGVNLYNCFCEEYNSKGRCQSAKWKHERKIIECSTLHKNYFLKWHDGLLNRVEFLLYDTSGKKISEDGGMIGGSICYTHKCKDGYKKVDNNCVATCDGGVEKDTIEATIDECKKNWPEWEGKDAAETCHKECFDSGEWKYVIDTCKAGYERVNAGGVLCKQKEQEAKGGAETTKTPGVATVSSDAAHPVATTPGADAGNPGGAGGNAPLATTPGADAGNPVVTETSDAETPGTGNSATATGNVTPTTADSDAGYVQEVHSDCKDEAKVVKPASGGECPGNANKKVTIKACVKDRHSGDAVEYATVSWVGTKNFSGVIADKDGCFELKNVPGNAMLSIEKEEENEQHYNEKTRVRPSLFKAVMRLV